MIGLEINLSNIEDTTTRDAFEKVQDHVNARPLVSGRFDFMEIEILAAVTGLEVAHKLGFIPQDILVTKNTGTYIWNYSAFTKDYVSITTSGAVSLRCFIGSV